MANIDTPAFGFTRGDHHPVSFGLSKREYAAVALRYPDSGDQDIDSIIRRARRLEIAAQLMTRDGYGIKAALADADALLAAEAESEGKS